ncbi:MAG: exopolysaccharide biosynthesis protein [Anaerolineae bacterium]|nr:exopolysaccharide biosynthesis protein [Anaerolineae bacterium]
MTYFFDTDKKLSDTLTETAQALPPEGITLRQMFEQLGEQGLLVFCVILTIPNLLPVQLPGASTVFGLLILFLGIGVVLNRIPWLPERLMRRHLHTKDLVTLLNRGSHLCARIDRLSRPRLLSLTGNTVVNRFNGLMLLLGAVLLMMPLTIIPFSNTLPAWGILLVCIGILQRDGLMILVSYVFTFLTVLYFGGIAVVAMITAGGLTEGISQLFGFVPLLIGF